MRRVLSSNIIVGLRNRQTFVNHMLRWVPIRRVLLVWIIELLLPRKRRSISTRGILRHWCWIQWRGLFLLFSEEPKGEDIFYLILCMAEE